MKELLGYASLAFAGLGALAYIKSEQARKQFGAWHRAVGSIAFFLICGVVLIYAGQVERGKSVVGDGGARQEKVAAATTQANITPHSAGDDFKLFVFSSMGINIRIDNTRNMVSAILQGQAGAGAREPREAMLKAVSEVLFAQKGLRKEIDDANAALVEQFKSEDQRQKARLAISHLGKKLSALEASAGGMYGMIAKEISADTALNIIKESLSVYDAETNRYLEVLRQMKVASGS